TGTPFLSGDGAGHRNPPGRCLPVHELGLVRGPLPGSHQGLLGLRERADLLHGTLHAGPTTEGGYRVHLRIPLTAD
ncbi:hypothetical protein ABZ931_31050, partial [Streptomyces neyagawaensis]